MYFFFVLLVCIGAGVDETVFFVDVSFSSMEQQLYYERCYTLGECTHYMTIKDLLSKSKIRKWLIEKVVTG